MDKVSFTFGEYESWRSAEWFCLDMMLRSHLIDQPIEAAVDFAFDGPPMAYFEIGDRRLVYTAYGGICSTLEGCREMVTLIAGDIPDGVCLAWRTHPEIEPVPDGWRLYMRFVLFDRDLEMVSLSRFVKLEGEPFAYVGKC
jgi:hypothetical protein